jgi:hypothetical protein
MEPSVAIVLSIVACLLGVVSFLFGGLLLDRAVARQRRLIGQFEEWATLEAKLKAGQGTLILNRTNLSGRVWWAPGSVESDHEGISLLTRQNGAIFTVPPTFMRLNEASLRQRYPCAVKTVHGVVRT